MAESRKSSDNRKSAESRKYPGQLVYGLDIGTRSIVGTVGYMYDKKSYTAEASFDHMPQSGETHDYHLYTNGYNYPYRKGYAFDGFYFEKSYKTRVKDMSDAFARAYNNPNGRVTVYAKWTKKNCKKVTLIFGKKFNPPYIEKHTGYDKKKKQWTLYLKKGQRIAEVFYPSFSYSDNKYQITGFYSDKKCKKKVADDVFDLLGVTVNKNMKLYAKMKKVKG